MAEHDLRSSLQQLRGRIVTMQVDGLRHFAFFSARAGEGTSTVCLQLANLLTQQPHAKVLLVDANLSRPVLHKLLAARPHDGLCELLTEKTGALSAVQDVGAFDFLSCGELTESPAQLLRYERVKRVMDDLALRFDFVVWDLPPLLESPEIGPALRVADASILVLEAERTRHEVALAAQRAASDAEAKLVGVVLNRRRYHIPPSVYRLL